MMMVLFCFVGMLSQVMGPELFGANFFTHPTLDRIPAE